MENGSEPQLACAHKISLRAALRLDRFVNGPFDVIYHRQANVPADLDAVDHEQASMRADRR